MGALDGVRVGGVPGRFPPGALAVGYACRLLADLGADVWVADPSALPVRLHDYLLAGVTLVPSPEDLAAGVDLVLDGAGTDVADRPVVRITPFGRVGPRTGEPATDLTLQASGAWVSSHGIPGLDPVRVGGRAPGWVGGAYAAAAGLTALRIGGPVEVDLSLQACLVGTLPSPMLFQLTLDRIGQVLAERRFVVPGIVACADGHVGINCLTGQHWLDMCSLLDVPDWERRQRAVIEQPDAYDGFVEAARPWLEARTAADVVEICQAVRIPAAPIGNGATLPALAQFAERGFYRPLPGGTAPVPGPAYRLAATPAVPGPPPVDGEPPDDRPPPRATDGLPYEGLRVLDLSIFWAGPYLTQYLASLGADVVKVESIQRPDGFRYSASFPELGADWYERSLVWQATNLSKRDITLDLTRPEGRDLLWRLLADADVVVENFSPRVAEAFGLTDDAVRAATPNVVYLRMPGFGLVGPWRDHVGWAMVYEQACGLAQVTGHQDGPPLNPGGFADPVVGMHAATALQAALRHREHTGEGQLVEIAQIEVMAAITAEQVLEAAATGTPPGRTGNHGDEVLEEDVLPAGGGWVAVSLRHQADADAAQAVTGGVDLADWLSIRQADEAAAALVDAGVPASAVLGTPDMLADPQLRARGYYQELTHPLTGAVPYPGWPMSFSAGVARHHRSVAPTLGQHNEEVLGGELGLSADQLAVLGEAGIIGVALPAVMTDDLVREVVGDAWDDRVEAAVAAHPHAALVCAQLLAAAPHDDIETGLVAESLGYGVLQGGPELAAWLADRGSTDLPAPSPDPVRLERDGDRLTITLHRPEVHNAVDVSIRDALVEAFALVAADPEVTVELRGDGPSFCSGGDLREFGTFPDPASAHGVRSERLPARALAAVAHRVTAHVHGACVGAGVELAAFCHRVVAAPDATFRLPEVGMGLVPGQGGTVSLPRRIGRERTAWLALTGETITTPTAMAWGLVDEAERV